jgi:uncharacterized membrane protein
VTHPGAADDVDTSSMRELAPVEYVVIDFPGNRFDGSIVPALIDLVERRVVRILDLVFVKKDLDGSVTSFEFDQRDEVADFAAIDGDAGDVLSEDDVAELATSIPDGSSALCILWEDLWAAGLGRAIRDAGGELRYGGRLPHRELIDILAPLESKEVTA